MALSPEDIAMLKEAGLVNEAAEAHYRALQARANAKAAPRRKVRPARPRPAVQTDETRLRAMIDKAVAEALARPEVGEAIDQLTEAAEVSYHPSPPVKPLHTMTSEEWREHGRSYWEAHQPAPYRPLTIGELTAGRYEDEA